MLLDERGNGAEPMAHTDSVATVRDVQLGREALRKQRTGSCRMVWERVDEERAGDVWKISRCRLRKEKSIALRSQFPETIL